jgi:hypothetical protein
MTAAVESEARAVEVELATELWVSLMAMRSGKNQGKRKVKARDQNVLITTQKGQSPWFPLMLQGLNIDNTST